MLLYKNKIYSIDPKTPLFSKIISNQKQDNDCHLDRSPLRHICGHKTTV